MGLSKGRRDALDVTESEYAATVYEAKTGIKRADTTVEGTRSEVRISGEHRQGVRRARAQDYIESLRGAVEQ